MFVSQGLSRRIKILCVQLVKAREVERKKAIADGKMDDPLVAKRLEDAITIVGTCQHMCPRFERYRRERENNLFEWETVRPLLIVPLTLLIVSFRSPEQNASTTDGQSKCTSALQATRLSPQTCVHPSSSRQVALSKSPIPTHFFLQKTLDYLFHDLLGRAGFSQTYTFIRDRSRAVRNDFTMQHESGHIAIECHNRCARFHILALHFERDKPGFSVALEEQQLMNSKISLSLILSPTHPLISLAESQRILHRTTSTLYLPQRTRDARLPSSHPHPRPARTPRRPPSPHRLSPRLQTHHALPSPRPSQVCPHHQDVLLGRR